MCGRFTLVANSEILMQRFQLHAIPFQWNARYNIAPSQLIPVILEERGERRIGQLKWGLVPSWVKDEKSCFKMINARAETLNEKPAFRKLFERKRCLIPADGFYEWKRTENKKQPMRIVLKNEEPFAFAGLFDTWYGSDGQRIHSCTIITTRPNQVVEDIHDRMPVILRQGLEKIWLNREYFDAELLQSLLVPYDAEEMRAYPVSHLVGNPRNDIPACIDEA